MPRGPRAWTDQLSGSYHLISRVADRSVWFSEGEKEYFLRLLERLAEAFFVQLHAFCIMGNHFHLLVTALEREAAAASEAELQRRYRRLRGPNAEPPAGSVGRDGELDLDADGGVARLRRRLGSMSRFMQELKQSFTRWYNPQHDRRGTLWSDRFKSVLVSKAADAELVVAAYIDLNPIRASLAETPDDYRWCSAGLRARSPRRAERLLTPLATSELRAHGEAWYRVFLYETGGLRVAGKRGRIAPDLVASVRARAGRLGVLARLRFRWRNLSEGVAVGGEDFVADVQRSHKRRTRPRPLLEDDGSTPDGLFTTRRLRSA